MTKHLKLLLFIGLVCGQVEIDTSYIDYYLEGKIAAQKNHNSKSFSQIGCLFSYYAYPMSLIIPFKIHSKHSLKWVGTKLYPSKIGSNKSELFKDGYKNQIRKLRFKDATKGIIYRVLLTFAANGVFQIIAGGIILH
tara:strand:+ start:77 stop:487 length:411 start_codon:yes stop_codon:yes gene_type:complete